MRDNPRSHHPVCACQSEPSFRLTDVRGEHFVGGEYTVTCHVTQPSALYETQIANGTKTVRRCMGGCNHWHAYSKDYVAAVERAAQEICEAYWT